MDTTPRQFLGKADSIHHDFMRKACSLHHPSLVKLHPISSIPSQIQRVAEPPRHSGPIEKPF